MVKLFFKFESVFRLHVITKLVGTKMKLNCYVAYVIGTRRQKIKALQINIIQVWWQSKKKYSHDMELILMEELKKIFYRKHSYLQCKLYDSKVV